MKLEITDHFFTTLLSIEFEGKTIKAILTDYVKMDNKKRQENREWLADIKISILGAAYETDGKLKATDHAEIGIFLNNTELEKALYEAGFDALWEFKSSIKDDEAFTTVKNCRVENDQFRSHCFDLQKIIDRYF